MGKTVSCVITSHANGMVSVSSGFPVYAIGIIKDAWRAEAKEDSKNIYHVFIGGGGGQSHTGVFNGWVNKHMF